MDPRERGVVLLVEDDEGLRDALADALREGGHRVAAVADGRAALRWLSLNDQPALILLDLWLPNLDGWRLRRQIESHADLRDIPIVVLTAAPNQRAEILDVREVLSKPVTYSRLLETVERHI